MDAGISTEKIIYTILKRLETAMDEVKPDFMDIMHEAIGISETRWKNIILMLLDEHLITNVDVIPDGNSRLPILLMSDARITLRGINYMEELKKKNEGPLEPTEIIDVYGYDDT